MIEVNNIIEQAWLKVDTDKSGFVVQKRSITSAEVSQLLNNLNLQAILRAANHIGQRQHLYNKQEQRSC